MHDFNPEANLHSGAGGGGGGGKFAPGCIFGHVNGVFRIFSRVQIFYLLSRWCTRYLHPVQIVHMNS